MRGEKADLQFCANEMVREIVSWQSAKKVISHSPQASFAPAAPRDVRSEPD
jgi:hypothetical protein